MSWSWICLTDILRLKLMNLYLKLLSLLEPFIDTVVIYNDCYSFDNYWFHNVEGVEGFKWPLSFWFSIFLVSIFIGVWFSYLLSTMISWSYYGLKSWEFLFCKSKNSEYSYKLLFLIFIVIGSSVKLGAVLDFSDMMILKYGFPNILGLIILSRKFV